MTGACRGTSRYECSGPERAVTRRHEVQGRRSEVAWQPSDLSLLSPVIETRTSMVSRVVPKRLNSRLRLRAPSRQWAERGYGETEGALASRVRLGLGEACRYG